MSGRPKGELMLSESEREELQALTMRRKTAQALALRARSTMLKRIAHRGAPGLSASRGAT